MISSATAASESETIAAQKNYKIVQDAGNFDEVQATRPNFNHSAPIEITKSPNPNWNYGDGVPDHGASLAQKHHEIDPYAPDRPMINNYRLLVSGIAPRPVGFLSTVNAGGEKNLSPFSYFQVIDHDPPMFIVGFSSRPGRVKDTYHNLKETGECVINTVSENMIEAVNATSIDAPYGVSEWDVSGLHEAPSSTVKPSRVAESVFNIEGKVIDIKEFTDHQKPGMSLAATVLIKATRFWVKEGTSDAAFSHIDLDKLRPVGQLGGISYGRIGSTFEAPRKRWSDEVPKSEILSALDTGNCGKSFCV
jgi:flavin reductase (DIM6/NTAB) family NADH-FMN oxidoreductase RutF